MPGHVGKSISPADNMDVFDTLTPMWNDPTLTPNERALVYACGVLHRKIAQLENSLLKANIKLEEDAIVQEMLSKMTGGRRKRGSKKASKKSSKKGSKTQKGGKKRSKKASKKTSKKSKKSSKKTSRK